MIWATFTLGGGPPLNTTLPMIINVYKITSINKQKKSFFSSTSDPGFLDNF
jgi:hypothetical protein